ncbi:MAG: Rieske 2Fe-2S domain-containing protein, partial [Burkholderiaceae bacterium]|nr:Rieske 2Fe-2S domain-containing protein [Burkholderiaceae bacterium]
MLSRQDNERLTRTGPGTPMGALFRSFWIPVLLSREIAEPDCPPVRVKVMGEDLIAFRDSTGRPALVDPVCPHRGASLFFGRNEGGGIRCAYHGWKFDAEGRCMDLPSMPSDTSYREKMRLTAYPARDWGGLVWAYMGPLGEGEAPPPLPQMEFALLPPENVFVTKKYQECNWAQACEGGLDTAHFSFLHMDTTTDADRLLKVMKGAEAGGQSDRLRWLQQDGMPRFTVHAHPAGLVLGAARNADEGRLYWRVSQFLMPC